MGQQSRDFVNIVRRSSAGHKLCPVNSGLYFLLESVLGGAL
jgi:hypothetical protein